MCCVVFVVGLVNKYFRAMRQKYNSARFTGMCTQTNNNAPVFSFYLLYFIKFLSGQYSFGTRFIEEVQEDLSLYLELYINEAKFYFLIHCMYALYVYIKTDFNYSKPQSQ